MTEDNKNIKIIVDRSEELKLAQATIDKLNQKIGSQEELLKRYLAEDAEKERQKAIRVNEPAPPPIGGETCTLTQEEEAKKGFKIPYDEASQVLDIVSFPNANAALDFLKQCADNPNSGDYKLAKEMYGRAIKKALRVGGTYQFQGNMARYELKDGKIVKGIRPQTFKQVED